MKEGKKKKKYEPPMVKEIGGVFQQAMGVSQCVNGPSFVTSSCTRGWTASTGCAQGNRDQACNTGATDTFGCSIGQNANGPCTQGASVN